jgi:hypothetical protein
MNEFKKYQHIERLGSTEVEGILLGHTYIFPKIDGSNGSVWCEDGEICAGSRNRKLSLDNDNQGFLAYIKEHPGITEFLNDVSDVTLFGEWLVPHTLKTYRPECWRRFYIFDVMIKDKYIPYDDYTGWLDAYKIDYVPIITHIENPNIDHLQKALKQNTYLIEDGKGTGEGIVIKNYDFTNKYGHVRWGKIVANEFKEKHNRIDGIPGWENYLPEKKLVEKFLTEEMIKKTYAKVIVDNPERKSVIPRLLETVFHDFVVEEVWNMIKETKRKPIDFRQLNHYVVQKVKETLKEVF